MEERLGAGKRRDSIENRDSLGKADTGRYEKMKQLRRMQEAALPELASVVSFGRLWMTYISELPLTLG